MPLALAVAPLENVIPKVWANVQGMGICHSYTPDGRRISLLKILLTNFCVFDCKYCINRLSSHVKPARFTPMMMTTGQFAPLQILSWHPSSILRAVTEKDQAKKREELKQDLICAITNGGLLKTD